MGRFCVLSAANRSKASPIFGVSIRWPKATWASGTPVMKGKWSCRSPARLATPNTVGGPWIGEYLGLAADSTHAYVGFASSITDANSGDVYFDRLANSEIPEPASAALLLTGLPWLIRRRLRR